MHLYNSLLYRLFLLGRTEAIVFTLKRGYVVASFPGRSHLQYLIAYSMQIRRGKAWEIWSRAVTSGRQMVDTRGAVPTQFAPSTVSGVYFSVALITGITGKALRKIIAHSTCRKCYRITKRYNNTFKQRYQSLEYNLGYRVILLLQGFNSQWLQM